MTTQENKIYHLYIVDKNVNNFPIEWMELKDVDTDESLLQIPYSLLIYIADFTEAVYKRKITLPKSLQETVLKCVRDLYTNSELIFLKHFIDIISHTNQNIQLNINIENIQPTHLYFLTFLEHFGWVESVENKEIIITIYKQDILYKAIKNINNKDSTSI